MEFKEMPQPHVDEPANNPPCASTPLSSSSTATKDTSSISQQMTSFNVTASYVTSITGILLKSIYSNITYLLSAFLTFYSTIVLYCESFNRSQWNEIFKFFALIPMIIVTVFFVCRALGALWRMFKAIFYGREQMAPEIVAQTRHVTFSLGTSRRSVDDASGSDSQELYEVPPPSSARSAKFDSDESSTEDSSSE